MNLKKKCQVVMLPTKKATMYIASRQLYSQNSLFNLTDACKPQHLYIISDDKIKEGDWYIDDTNTVRQSVTSDKEYWSVRQDYKKIIATTDSSLLLPIISFKKWDGKPRNLPQPSSQFIQKYIESYNKGEIITDVMVEYEQRDFKWIGEKNLAPYYLKVDSQNCITITKLKDSWSKEEVETLIVNCDTAKMTASLIDKSWSIRQWIEKNLCILIL